MTSPETQDQIGCSVLLSVHPRFAGSLVDGSKTVEIRRRRAHLPAGMIALIYATAPQSELIGAVRVEATDFAPPADLWRRWGASSGLEHQFNAYLAGRPEACAIVLGVAARFSGPVGLAELRERHRASTAPQSYRFMAETNASRC